MDTYFHFQLNTLKLIKGIVFGGVLEWYAIQFFRRHATPTGTDFWAGISFFGFTQMLHFYFGGTRSQIG